MKFINFENVGCSQTATKNTIKTAKIHTEDNNLEATRHHLQYNCGSCSSVWPKNNKNNNKISTQRHLRLLLITMTVSMTFLQLPYATTAAAATVHGKHARHLYGSEPSHDSGSNSIDEDTVEIEHHDHNNEEGSSLPKRKRLHKRHSASFYLRHHLEESETDLEWSNPCNGFFEPSADKSSIDMPPFSYFLWRLRRTLNREYHFIDDMKVINTTDLRLWRKHKGIYSYLPKINIDSKITLGRWYSQMQIYVATFAHLSRMQYKFDQKTLLSSSGLTNELDELLISARSILCEIETTINGSYPYPTNKKKLRSFTREEMNRRIQFLSDKRIGNDAREPDMIDLKFAKFKYFHYLRRMWRVIRIRSKRRANALQLSKSLESNDVSSFDMPEDNMNSSINELNLSESRSSSSSSASESFEGSVEYGSHAGRAMNRSRSNRRKNNSRRKIGPM